MKTTYLKSKKDALSARFRLTRLMLRHAQIVYDCNSPSQLRTARSKLRNDMVHLTQIIQWWADHKPPTRIGGRHDRGIRPYGILHPGYRHTCPKPHQQTIRPET